MKNQWLPLIPIALVCCLMLAFHASTTGGGKPLPDGTSNLYAALPVDFVHQLTTSTLAIALLPPLLCAAILAGSVLFWKKIPSSLHIFPLLLYVAVWVLLSFVSFIPTGRGQTPFYPLVVLALVELAGWYRAWLAEKASRLPVVKAATALSIAFSLWLAISFLSNMNIYDNATNGTFGSNKVRADAMLALGNGILSQEHLDYRSSIVAFYRDKFVVYCHYDIYTGEPV